MSLVQWMRSRHSARVPFDRGRPLPDDALLQILEAARWAPTAHNMQNFQIVAVDDNAVLEKLGAIPAEISEAFIRENYRQLSFTEEELRRKKTGILGTMFPPSWRTPGPDMAEIARERGDASLHDTIQDSPSLLIVLYDPRTRAPASEGDFLGVISLGCVLENLWLAAESLGVGFQVMSTFAGERTAARVKELLAIPRELQIAFAVRLGYPLRPPPPLRVRRDLGDFVHHNRFGRHDLGEAPHEAPPEEPLLRQAIVGRRSIRAFHEDPIAESQIDALLDAAVWAPTAMHREPWSFAVIQDRGLLLRLSERAKAILRESGDEHARALVDQPGFNVFYDAGTLIVIGAPLESHFVVADCWLAAQNLMLAAYGMGLGSCVIGFAVAALQQPDVKAELGIPAEVVPIAPIIVGVPRGDMPVSARRPPRIVTWRRGA